jgi:hypothetical protein
MGRAVSDRWMLKFAKDWLDMLHSTGGNDILMTRTDQIAKYFQGLSQMTACSVAIDEYSTIPVSENAFLFAGLNTFSRTNKEGKVFTTPARFTLLITKTDQGWRISHFHSSTKPT